MTRHVHRRDVRSRLTRRMGGQGLEESVEDFVAPFSSLRRGAHSQGRTCRQGRARRGVLPGTCRQGRVRWGVPIGTCQHGCDWMRPSSQTANRGCCRSLPLGTHVACVRHSSPFRAVHDRSRPRGAAGTGGGRVREHGAARHVAETLGAAPLRDQRRAGPLFGPLFGSRLFGPSSRPPHPTPPPPIPWWGRLGRLELSRGAPPLKGP